MEKKKTELFEKQQARILRSSKNCFLKKGLAHTTMRDIATQADMSLGNIYRYFKNKGALIHAFIERDNQEIDDAFSLLDDSTKNFRKLLKQIAREFLSLLSIKAEVLIYLDILSEALRNEEILKLMEFDKGEELLAKRLRNAVIEKRIHLITTPAVTALAIMAFIENAALKSIVNKGYTVRSANKELELYLDALIQD